jgi:thioredoxin-related protein
MKFESKFVIPIIIIILIFLFVLYISTTNSSNNSSNISNSLGSSDSSGSSNSSNSSKKVIIYNFSSKSCPACVRFTNDWNEIVKFYMNNSQVTTTEIDVSKPENKALTTRYNITHTPTIYIITQIKQYEYNGPRNAFDIVEHINGIIN